jgi:hypothetical protein
MFIVALSIISTAYPMSLYNPNTNIKPDIRYNPYCRRQLLNNLHPRDLFDPTHEACYGDLNWKPRAAMMMLLSQMKMKIKQQGSSHGFTNETLLESRLAQPSR